MCRVLGKRGGGAILKWGGTLPSKECGLVGGTFEGRMGLECQKEGILDGLMPERIFMKLERYGLPIPSCKALYNRVAYIRRTLTIDNLKFNTKDLRDLDKAFKGSID